LQAVGGHSVAQVHAVKGEQACFAPTTKRHELAIHKLFGDELVMTLQAYAAKGVHKMYPWQAAALECGKSGNNLVYCAPTSGGKSLVAEILLIRRLCNTKRPGRPHGGFHVSTCSALPRA
jgi:ATP-dependent helicase YprA (DUF1998 family)